MIDAIRKGIERRKLERLAGSYRAVQKGRMKTLNNLSWGFMGMGFGIILSEQEILRLMFGIFLLMLGTGIQFMIGFEKIKQEKGE